MSRALAINLSLNTVSSYNTAGADSIKFEFPLDSVDFSREGNSLIIASNDGSGSQALLHNYFVENTTNTLPTFELVDGTIVNGVDFLTDYEIDTAAGPSESTNGLNSYSDNAGELISGVDKLGVLGRESLLSANDNASNENSFLIPPSSNGNGGDNNGGDNNGGDDSIRDIEERFVFQPTSQITSEVNIKVTNPSNEAIEVTSCNKEYIKSYEVNADGSITVELTEAGKEALKNAGSKGLTLDLTVSVGGEDRGVEVIINSPKDFASSEADTAGHIQNPIVYEHHKMHETYKNGHLVAGGTKQSDVTVETSNGHGVENVTIQGTGKTTVDITTSGSDTSGINAENGETNILHSLGNVTVKGEWSGISTSDAGTTTINDVNGYVSVKGGVAGIKTDDEATTTIETVTGDVSVTGGDKGIQHGTMGPVPNSFKMANIYSDSSDTSNPITSIHDVTGNVKITGTNQSGIDNNVGTVEIFDVKKDALGTGGNVSVTGGDTGISTYGKLTTTTIKDVAGDVTVKGDMFGIAASEGGTTTISGVGDKVTVTGGMRGIAAYGTTTTIENVAGDVSVNGGETGIYATGDAAKVTIKAFAGDVNIAGESSSDERSYGIENAGGKIKISGAKENGTVIGHNITVSGGTTGIDTSFENGETTIEEVKGNIKVTGGTTGINTSYYGGTTISGVEKDDTGTGGNVIVEGAKTGIYTSYATTTIKDVTGNISVKGGTTGIYSYGPKTTTTIKDFAGNVEITGTNEKDSYGIENTSSRVEISGKGENGTVIGQNVSVAGGMTGLSTSAGTTTIKDLAGNVTVKGGTTGIDTSYGGTTTISGVKGDVSITGTTGTGIYNKASAVEISKVGSLNINGGTTGSGIKNYNGTVDISEIGSLNINGSKYGIEAVERTTTITNVAGKVEISGGGSSGIYLSGGTSNVKISGVGEGVTVTGEKGISNDSGGTITITDVAGDVNITGKTKESIFNQSGTVEISGKEEDGALLGQNVIVTGNTRGIYTFSGTTTIKDFAGNVNVEGKNGDGIYLSGKTSSAEISHVGTGVTVTGGTIGISNNSSNTTIKDVAGDVTITGEKEEGIKNTGTVAISDVGKEGTDTGGNVTVTGGTKGIYTYGSGAKTTIEGVTGNVTVTGSEKGIFSDSKSTTTINNFAGDINITATNTTDSSSGYEGKFSGIYSNNGTVNISGLGKDGSVIGQNVTVKGGTAGIFTEGSEAKTTISDVHGVTVDGGLNGIFTTGLKANTTITNVGDVTVTGVRAGISANTSGITTITNVTNLKINGTGDGSNGTGIASANSASVNISDVKDVTVTGSITGISSYRGGSTTIEDVAGKVIISGGTSSISSDRDSETTISANDIELKGRVFADHKSINTIGYNKDSIAEPNSPITVTITANNATGGYALSATHDSKNIIQGSTSSESDHITIVGGISADAGSANIIKTGAGTTIITLDGKIDVSKSIGLDIQKGEGWSQLVLTAPTLEVFMERYSGWLEKLAGNTSIKDSLGITTIEVALPGELGNLTIDELLAQTGHDGFNTLIKELQDHGVEVTTSSTQTHEGASTTSLLTASADNTYDNHTVAKAEDDQTSAQNVAKAEDNQAIHHSASSLDDNQTVAQSSTNVEDNQATHHSVASLDDDQTSAQSATLADDSQTTAHSMDLIDFTSTEDIYLTDADDIVQLIGGQYSHILDMGGGDDMLSIIDTDLTGGAIFMGKGNDHLNLAGDVTLDHTSIDGGSGYDVLELGDLSALHASDGTLDLSSLVDSVSGFEVIDLSGSSGTLHVDIDSLLGLGIDAADAVHYTLSASAQGEDFNVNSLSADNTLVIKADSNESVSFDANWHDSGATVSDGGHEYSVYTTSHEEDQYFILLQAGV